MDIFDYETRVKKYREVTKYDELSSEQSRVLFMILTAGDQKFTDQCLKQVNNRMDKLTLALLPAVGRRHTGPH